MREERKIIMGQEANTDSLSYVQPHDWMIKLVDRLNRMQVFANTRKFEGNKQMVVEWKTQITQLQSSISYLELSNGAGEKEEKKELFTYKQTIVINYCVQTFIISTGEWTTFSHAAALCVHVVTVVVPWAQQQATGQDVCVCICLLAAAPSLGTKNRTVQ